MVLQWLGKRTREVHAQPAVEGQRKVWCRWRHSVGYRMCHLRVIFLKDGAAFAAACSARLQAVGTMKASEEGCLGGNVLTEGSNVSNQSCGFIGKWVDWFGKRGGWFGKWLGWVGLFGDPAVVL